ncbi:hypothetical protein COUCH_31625 [Couchioplanes caeruleus]|uniref:hypothetical protein n=1 Tax=Couchioplanes caeruleus TaxID=56438 RepID=UPI0020BE8AB8|nr:hypothetical protein [Couchioplanes caeruleus]UQU63520.1 hypothetical protein COUCH_31625 [Couchioplanes caeruleus]
MFTAPVRTVARTAALAAIVLTLPACVPAEKAPSAGSPATPGSAPARTVAATTTPTRGKPTPRKPEPAATKGILAGKRQVVIAPVGSTESVLTVDDKGRLSLTDGPSDRTLFVLVPVGDGKHQIRTAKAGASGEPACMGVRDGGGAATVVAAACDAGRAGQRFTVESEAQRDGRPAYTIGAEGGLRLSVDRSGLVATPGRGTPFTLVDNGAAPAGPGD